MKGYIYIYICRIGSTEWKVIFKYICRIGSREWKDIFIYICRIGSTEWKDASQKRTKWSHYPSSWSASQSFILRNQVNIYFYFLITRPLHQNATSDNDWASALILSPHPSHDYFEVYYYCFCILNLLLVGVYNFFWPK